MKDRSNQDPTTYANNACHTTNQDTPRQDARSLKNGWNSFAIFVSLKTIPQHSKTCHEHHSHKGKKDESIIKTATEQTGTECGHCRSSYKNPNAPKIDETFSRKGNSCNKARRCDDYQAGRKRLL
jgi:hypothetical protein